MASGSRLPNDMALWQVLRGWVLRLGKVLDLYFNSTTHYTNTIRFGVFRFRYSMMWPYLRAYSSLSVCFVGGSTCACE